MKVCESKLERLDNGLRLITAELPHLHSVYIGAFVPGGKHYETAANNGVSHFLEHLHLSTTASHPTRETFAREVDAIPGETNAETSPEHLHFWMHTSPQYLSRAGQLLAEAMSVRDYDDETIESERLLILAEIEGAEPDWQHEVCGNFFGHRPYALAGTGTKRSVRRLTRKALADFDRSVFSPDRMVVSVAGRINPDQLDGIRAHMAAIQRMSVEPIELPPIRPSRRRSVKVTCATGTRRSVTIAFHTSESMSANERVLMWLVDWGLNLNAGLGNDLRYGSVRSYHTWIGHDEVQAFGLFFARSRTARRARSAFLDEMLKQARRLREGCFESAWLDSVKSRLLFAIETVADFPQTLGERNGSFELARVYRPCLSLEEEVQTVRTSSRDDLVNFARRLFDTDQSCVFVGTKNPLHWKGRYARLLDRYLS